MNDGLDNYIDRVKHLPTPPVVMLKLICAFQQPDPDVDEVTNLVRKDASLTAEVLRRCNSAMFSGDEPTVDIFDALTRLGFYEVYQAAVTMFGIKSMSTDAPIGLMQPCELWQHAAATAVLSGMLAKETGEPEGVAYTAGLLHDIGKLVLASAEGIKYGDLMQRIGNSGGALEIAEKEIFGFGHGAIGARLLERWNLPVEISKPVFCHHDLTVFQPVKRMSAIVNMANVLAHHLEDDEAQGAVEFSEAMGALFVLQLSANQIISLTRRAKNEIKALETMIEAK